MAIALLGWLALPAGRAAAAAESDYIIRNWTSADGLPENTVRAIVESRDGYLWLGTANGLARFDGVRFTRFDTANTPDLVSDNIFALLEDREGALWLQTARGLVRFFRGRFEHIPVTNRVPHVIARDTEGMVWCGGMGLNRWNGTRMEPVPLAEPGPRRIEDLCAAAGGGLWIAGENELWLRHPDGRLEASGIPAAPRFIAAGPDGRVWGLTDQRILYVRERGAWSVGARLGETPCFTVSAMPNGDVWLGAGALNRAGRLRDGELTWLDGRHGLEGNRTICFTTDREGNVWIGMNGAGLYRLRERRVDLFDRNSGLQALSLASICQDGNRNIHVAVMGWTLHRFEAPRFVPIPVQARGEPFVFPTALAPAPAGGVWAGTLYGSLSRVQDGRVVESIGANAGTRTLFTDRDGRLWRGTCRAGIEVFAGTNVTRFTTNEGLSFNNIYCFAQDAAGAVWAGTEAGLSRIEGSRITRFSRTNGLGHHFISTLCTDSRGTLWAGTLGGGLSAWNGTRFVTLTTREGLPHDTVEQLLEDDLGHLWIGTRGGLMRVSVAALNDCVNGRIPLLTGTLVGRDDGLVRPDSWTEYQPAACRDRDGNLWFCTRSGVVRIDPRRFATTAPAPIVQVEEVSIDGRLQPRLHGTAGELVVPPGRQRLEIRYTGLSPSSPEQVRFRYRLTGYDRDWVEAGRNRFASYSHLPPGKYEFQVLAANNDGVWTTRPASLAIDVKPAFWQTPAFRTLLVGLFLVSGPAFFLWRFRQLERRRIETDAFARQLIESQELERKRIAAELHDSLGQNLLVVRNLALMGSSDHAGDEAAAQQFREISDAAGQALTEVRSISHALRPVELDRLGLAKSIRAVIQRTGESSGIRFDVQVEDIDGALPARNEINLYRIVQECLNNIVKHARATTALVEIRRSGQRLQVVIADDGQGFDVASTVTGQGLVGIVERARTLGGTAVIQSRPGSGTRVEISVPVA